VNPFPRVLPKNIASQIFENDIYYNRKVGMGTHFNLKEYFILKSTRTTFSGKIALYSTPFEQKKAFIGLRFKKM